MKTFSDLKNNNREKIFNRLTWNIFQGSCNKKNESVESDRKKQLERRTIETKHISTVSSLGKNKNKYLITDYTLFHFSSIFHIYFELNSYISFDKLNYINFNKVYYNNKCLEFPIAILFILEYDDDKLIVHFVSIQ